MKTKFESYRILLTRLVAGIFLFFFITTQSYWETANEIVSFILFLIGIVLVAISSLGRMWCSLYIAGYKDKMLVTQGPYSLCRNPLYFFSLVGTIGVGCATETFTFPVVFFVIFVSYYGFIIRKEEARLRELFGETFDQYMKAVPAFFPRRAGFTEPSTYQVTPKAYRRNLMSALWFIWIVGILEVIEGLKEIGLFKSLWTLF